MEVALTLLVVAVALLSRPIVSRLWHAGRLSDRTTALLLVGRFPIVVFLFGLILRAPPPLFAGVTLLALLPAALFYRHTLEFLREQREYERRQTQAR